MKKEKMEGAGLAALSPRGRGEGGRCVKLRTTAAAADEARKEIII